MNTHLHHRAHGHASAHTTDLTEGPLLGKLLFAVEYSGFIAIRSFDDWFNFSFIGKIGWQRYFLTNDAGRLLFANYSKRSIIKHN